MNIVHQGPVLRTLGKVAIASATHSGGAMPELPTPVSEDRVGPRPKKLVEDYIRWCGGDVRSYRGRVPAHMFAQWAFPVMAESLTGLPWPMTRVLNQGCRIQQNKAIPAGEDILVRAWLEDITEDEHKVRLHQVVETGTRAVPDSVRVDMFAVVPTGKKRSGGGKKRERPRVPVDAREIGRLKFPVAAGREFAVLTGDFNPIHWIPPAAKASGFKNVIAHGFGQLARALEVVIKTRLGGDPMGWESVDVRFVRPLVMPAKIGVYIGEDGSFSTGVAPGGPAFLLGEVTRA